MANQHAIGHVGLGLRKKLLPELLAHPPTIIDFYEVAPENWLAKGGLHKKQFRAIAERYPLVCHGLSLSLGGTTPLDNTFILQLKQFFDEYHIACYSEHLSFCNADGHLYDLMPMPFTEQAVIHVSQRIKRVQDLLQRQIAIENISYYCTPTTPAMTELEFINRVLQQADCMLLLDINNVYVNSSNHHYCASEFLRQLPPQRINYLHVAGHYTQHPDLLIDTHANSVCDAVWSLLKEAYLCFGVLPTVLERDDRFPPLTELVAELEKIKQLQQDASDYAQMHEESHD